jgi:hypothetical protein
MWLSEPMPFIDMWLSEPMPFIEEFINDLDIGLQAHSPDNRLSNAQRSWLGFCIMGIILTSSICWARFERMSLSKYKIAALSWMFRKSKLPWTRMLQVGVGLILKRYGITEGILVTDGSDHRRSKKTPKLHKTKKLFVRLIKLPEQPLVRPVIIPNHQVN